MGLLASQPLSAAIGLALVLFLVWFLPGYDWLGGVLLLIATAYVAVPFTSGGDYVTHIMAEQIAVILFLFGRGMKIRLTGYVTSGVFRAILGISILSALWIWIQRGAPFKLWVAAASVVVVILWRIAANVGSSLNDVEADFHYEAAAEVTPEALMKRDEALLQAIYKVAHGCAGRFVAARDIAPFLQLSGHEAEVAVHRLIGSEKIEENEYGYALKRKGVEAYERQHANGKRRSTVSNIFNFHGSASGVFGSGNDVYGNKFTSGVLPDGLLDRLISTAAQVRVEATEPQARRIDAAVVDLRGAGDNPERLRSGAQRLVQIAATLGDIGVPLLRVAAEVMSALPG
ncbi:hypothetical protein GA0070610_1221 [Micromonospora echinofusca]|uniref:Uncharacterized protein n=1 Tax=Micromonospora echinofusca TaxID=47858 RepID=A0A1C5G556_MICEH|nr:hypothetical protein [Micromonospora echinofusca]SCG14994.1 hypothetical protein GA0070610_1221 [Micromonospora echinofusca]